MLKKQEAKYQTFASK